MAVTIAVMTLSACAGKPDGESLVNGNQTLCADPRLEACTMEYLPVCARLGSGEVRTYSNACGACTDPEVVEHSPGACE